MKIKKAEQAFSALAQESRLAVYRLLVDKFPDGVPAGELSQTLAIPSTTLSFHLSQLSGAKLVESRKEGRSVIYTANLKKAKKLAKFLTRKELLESSESEGDEVIDTDTPLVL